MDIQQIAKIFINPLLYVFIIFIWVLLRSNLKFRRKIYILLILYLFCIPLTSNFLLNMWSINDKYDKEKEYDSVLVLAGGIDYVWYILNKNHDKFDFERYFKFKGSEERIFTAIEFVRSGVAKSILYADWRPTLSYLGKDYTYNCSEKMKEFSSNMGIPKNKFIIYGNKIKRTIDEATQLEKYLETRHNSKILLITSQSHMRRAVGLFRHCNIFIDYYSVSKVTPILNSIFIVRNYIPSLNGLYNIQTFLYEFIGFGGYLLLGKI